MGGQINMGLLLFTATQCSSSDPDTCHTLSVWDDGTVSCSCTGYQFRKQCKHVLSVATIYGGHGQWALIDAADRDRVELYRWSVRLGKGKQIHYGNSRRAGGFLHRYILDLPKWINNKISPTVDFISGEGRDCRRSNMRVCKFIDNVKNRRKHIESSSNYLGVHRQRNGYAGQVHTDLGVLHHYSTNPTECAIWRDHMAANLHGEFASLNFPRAGNASRIYAMARNMRSIEYAETINLRCGSISSRADGRFDITAWVRETGSRTYICRAQTMQEAEEIISTLKRERIDSIINHDFMPEAVFTLSIERNTYEKDVGSRENDITSTKLQAEPLRV